MLDTTLTLFSSESIIDRLSAETPIALLFKGTWFVRLEVSRCKGSGIWIECPCCSFWWSFWKDWISICFWIFAIVVVESCVCARERNEKKLENLKIKRNSICRRLRIGEERKNRVLSSNSFNINVLLNVTSFSCEDRSQSSTDIELIYHVTFSDIRRCANSIFRSRNNSRVGYCENVIFFFVGLSSSGSMF